MIYFKKLSLAFVCGLLLAGCADSNQIGVPRTLAPFAANGMRLDIAHDLRSKGSPTSGAICCVYVSEYYSGNILEYNYDGTGAPFCTLSGLSYPFSIQSDAKGELIVPNSGGAYIYKERKHVCLPSAPPAKQVPDYDALDGFSLDGRTYYFAHDEGYESYIDVCKYGRRIRCGKQYLTAYGLYFPGAVTADSTGVYAVNFSQYGDGASLYYWKNGAVHGTALGGYSARFGGGIYFDGFGSLLSIDGSTAGSSLTVYSGCPSACKAHGPFPLHEGGVLYGSLNQGDTRFMTVSQFGDIDVYQYNGIYGLTYLYSNTTGLNPSAYPLGIAQDQ